MQAAARAGGAASIVIWRAACVATEVSVLRAAWGRVALEATEVAIWRAAWAQRVALKATEVAAVFCECERLGGKLASY